MLKDLQKKKLLERLRKEEPSENEDPKKMIDKDFYTQEVVIEGEPLGPTSVREANDQSDEQIKKPKKKK